LPTPTRQWTSGAPSSPSFASGRSDGRLACEDTSHEGELKP
jgi:hypothetical protein